MRHLFHFCWHKAQEYLGHLFFIGLFFLVVGAAPEKWVENQLEWLGGLFSSFDLSALARRFWPDWLDVRVALFALGTALSSASVVWRQLARRYERIAPPGPTPAKHIVLPYRSLGSLFKGRDQLLRDLRTSLTTGRQAAITSQALQLEEAEQLKRRALALVLAFQRDNGHAHPDRDAAIGNYTNLLAAMGQSVAQIAAAIAALRREVGLDQG